ncbi:MAG: nucleoside hydrolase-like domain-containing protein [Verrucomicrobiota bacterium]
MKSSSTCLAAGAVIWWACVLLAGAEPTRALILADMGNELDEEQQMIHMLMYSNEFDVEGLVAISSKALNADRQEGEFKSTLHPELFHELITEFEKVRGNLERHADNWPTVDYLRSIVKPGLIGFGIAAVGDGKSTEGTEHILECIKKNLTAGRLYITVNAGSNSLAQALWDLRKDSGIPEADKTAMLKRVFVFENGAQDNAGAWIAKNFPQITWYRSNYQTYAYGGKTAARAAGTYCWEPFPQSGRGQHEWSARHIQNDHGPLGERYPDRFEGRAFVEGGGTISWIGLANKGLFDPWNMWWGGWGGRVSRERHKNVMSRHPTIANGTMFRGVSHAPAESTFLDFFMYEADSEEETWTDPVHGETFTSSQVPVWRFRRAMWNDFRARMDWCVKSFAEANHNPVAHLNGDGSDSIIVMNDVSPGSEIQLSAKGSTDPDGDKLFYRWWNYREAGTYDGALSIPQPNAERTAIKVPADASRGDQIHIVLEIRDHEQEMASPESDEYIPLTDYRRLVLNVK